MNINKISFVLVLVMLVFASCKDEDLAPIVTFDSASKGAYPRLIEEGDKLLNLFDIDGSAYTYTIEFVDEQQGALVAEYVLDMEYNSNGVNEFRRFPASAFSANGNGYQQAPTITITANDAIAAAGVSAADLTAGDEFKFKGRVILQDGSEFTALNSSSTVRGSAFRGHFDFTLPANCPSDLTGTYSYATTDAWCDGSAVTGTVNIESQGGGVYNFSDWSFGAYGPCYGAIASQPTLTFSEVCAEVSFTGFTDSYGDTWTFDSSIDGENWTINWSNTYNESANSVITFPGGVPFTLK